MLKDDLNKRLELIKDTLKQKSDEAQLLSKNLEQINQNILILQGNLNECSFWLQMQQQPTINFDTNAEPKDEQANNQEA